MRLNRKTKKQLKRATLYALIFFFIAGTFLLYLPFSRTPAPTTSAPPLNQLPGAQQNVPVINATAVPAG